MLAFHIGIKDLKVTLRDRAAVAVLLAMPMVLILILGSALGGDRPGLSGVKVAIVNLDTGTTGARVTDSFFKDAKLRELFDAQSLRDPAEARDLVARGDLAGALIVGPDFTKKLNSGKPVQLTVLTDPGRQVSSGVFKSVAESLCMQVSAASVAVRTTIHYITPQAMMSGGVGGAVQKAISSATETEALSSVAVVERNGPKSRDISTMSYFSAGMSVMFLLFGSMFGAFSLMRERMNWTLPRMLTSHARKLDIIAGKMIGVFAVGLAQWTALFAFTMLLGGKWGPDLGAIWVLAMCTIAAAAGLSMLFASLAKSIRGVSGVAPLVIQFMAVMGGSMFPVTSFPAWLRPVHYATLNGLAMDGILGVMRGAGLAQVWPNALALLGMGAAFFTFGVWRLRWE
jgi:ABC-2 type transport system permease protein